ncbi:MAG TPA: hypothetical protein PKD63_04770 [Solirubrobacteraceae bacterium]|nr:hypothetical protein [Solirubrobacteraceae bacterium]
MTDLAQFEREYLRRASAAAASIEVNAIWTDRAPPPHGAVVIAGWWCPAELSDGAVVLPNPWDDRAAIALMDSWCWRTAQRVVAQLAPRLDEIHGERGEAYWNTLLAPVILHIVSAIADRRLFLVAASAIAPNAPVTAAVLDEPPATMAATARALRDPHAGSGLMGEMGRALGLEVAEPQTPLMRERSAPAPSTAFAPRLLGALREPRRSSRLAAEVVRLAAAHRMLRVRGLPQVTVVGHSGLDARNVVALGRPVPGLRVVQGVPCPSEIPPADQEQRRLLVSSATAEDDLERLTVAMLQQLLPRSVVEGFTALQEASLSGYGPPTHALVFGYAGDEVQNEFVARCAIAGRRLAFAQHGGFYLQAPVNAQERLEVREGSEFWSWGVTGPGLRRVPTPRLERIRDTHVGGELVTLIEGVHPPDSYLLRFASTPLGNQVYDGPERLASFVQASSPAVRQRMRLKRFPAELGVAPRLAPLEHLATSGPPAAGTAVEWMRASRLVVVSYPDTPFLEALVVGVPTVGLWNPAHWEWRDELRELIADLGNAGVVFAEPLAAAEHVNLVLSQGVQEWWSEPSVAAARSAFVDRLVPRGDWRDAWVSGLRDLAAD